MDDFLSKNNISKIYKYKEFSSNDNSIEFGWVESDGIDFDGEAVVAYHSKTKKATLDESSWSKSEGNSVTSLDDYIEYFFRSTGFQPSEFIDIYRLDKASLYRMWESGGGYDSDTVDFLYKLSNLLVSHKRFIHSGRGYKVVKI